MQRCSTAAATLSYFEGLLENRRSGKVQRLEGRGPLEDTEAVAPVELAAHQ